MSSIAAEKAYSSIRSVVRDPERLAAVRVTELLHSRSEVFFDRLTRIAAEVTRAPAAFLSLVDEDSDFYKSSYGFDEELARSRQISGITFCHYALVSDGPLVIEDTRRHPIFSSVPTVESLNVGAYLGVPLTLDGRPLGAFCVIDHRPRPWTEGDIDAVAALARAANAEIQARVNRRMFETNDEPAAPPPAVVKRLSKREMEVLSRILDGKGTKEIAMELDVSGKTVATHRGRMLKKLNLRSSRDLFVYAVRYRLVDWI